ncbi:MAG: hypothetical protein ABIA74_04730 [bacterium]
MKKKFSINPKFVVDKKENKVAVYLDIREFKSLIEELEDLHDILEAEKVIASDSKRYSLADLERSISGKR